MTRSTRLEAMFLLFLASAGFAIPALPAPELESVKAATAAVDDTRLRGANTARGDWLTHGRTYAEERHSPLDQIDASNVGSLELAWSFDTGTRRGLEATPIVVGGVLYVTGSWSKVYALDAATGKELWRWDPKVSEEVGRRACCDVVNRGVAVYRGKVFVGVLDGRLAALRADTGELVWATQTTDPEKPYTITGAPRVVEGKVIVGNGGAEYGVRGYVSAYDAATGKLAWRTYTVPGDPSKPFESKALERAAKTWKGGEWWKIGGGGTVWDSMAYDPALGLLYVGVGNGSPWTRHIRSPGGGDNLYLSSILALKPATGEIVWHYQTTPGDNWDYTATQHMILADLEIGGKKRAVLMQAPKNGFFYVLDRKTGELLSAEAFAPVTWAKGVDLATGRPIEVEDQTYAKGLRFVKPSGHGAHNWQPMSFSPRTGLVYIPVTDAPGAFEVDPEFEHRPGAWNTGVNQKNWFGITRDIMLGYLLAWDPVRQREVWRRPHPVFVNGGVLTTASDLVFQGTGDGRFVAYDAAVGLPLWQHAAPSGIIAAPVTYEAGGRQFVAVLAGWGGNFALYGGDAAAAANVQGAGAVLAFALPTEPTPADADPKWLEGRGLYSKWCAVCHGSDAIGGGVLPDLQKSQLLETEGFVSFVLHGIPGKAMPAFGKWVSEKEARLIQDYVRAEAKRP